MNIYWQCVESILKHQNLNTQRRCEQVFTPLVLQVFIFTNKANDQIVQEKDKFELLV